MAEKAKSATYRIGIVFAAAIIGIVLSSNSFAETKVEKTFGAWVVTCLGDATPKKCVMAQQRITAKGKEVVFIWSVGSAASNHLINNLVVPDAVSIKEGIRVAIGNKPQMIVPYDVCVRGRCVGTFPLDASALQSMSSSAVATATYVLASRKLMQIQVDLKDFPKAYDYFKSQVQ